MNKKSLKLVSAMLFLSGLPSGYIQTALGTTVAGSKSYSRTAHVQVS